MTFQYQSTHYVEAFSCTEYGTSIAEQKHSTNFMEVGRGEVYLLRKYAEQFLMHFHITHFFLYICIFIFAFVYLQCIAMCTYEAL